MKHKVNWKINNYYYKNVSGFLVCGALYLQGLPPIQSICSFSSSNVVWEGKEATGKLRQGSISKDKFMAQQKGSILTAQVPWQGTGVSQPNGSISASEQEAQGLCKALQG